MKGLQVPPSLGCFGATSAGCRLGALFVWSLVNMSASGAEPGLIKSEFIYESAPFPQCHASSIAESKAGLLAAWFGGTRERNPDVGIWLSRLERSHFSSPSSREERREVRWT